MRRFINVSVKNFFSFGPQEQTLELDGKGIININALNGYGKTTLCIEALTFAIYGKTRQDKIDDCVNRSIGQDTKVGVEFEGDDGEIYKIIRYRKHTAHNNAVYLFKGDKDISCKNAKDTDALIQDYIGMPYIAFINSTIFSGELYSNFLSAKNSERLIIFENILSLKEVNALYVKNKEILKEIDEKEESAKIDLSGKAAEASAIKSNIEGYTNNARSKLLALKDQKETAKKTIEESKTKLEDLLSINIDEEKAKVANLKFKVEYEAQINRLKTSRESLTSMAEPFAAKEMVEKYKDFDFADNKRKEEEAKKIEEEYSKIENELLIKEKESDSLKEKVLTSDFRTKEMNSKEEQLNSELDKIKDSICPYCGQKMNEKETEEKKSAILKKIEEFKKDKEVFLEELVKVANDYDSSVKKVEELKEKIKDRPIIEYIPNSDLEEEKFNNAKQTLLRYVEAKQTYEKNLNDINNQIKELEDKVSGLVIPKYSEAFISNLENEINELKETITKNEASITAIDSSVHSVYDKDYIDKMNSDLKEKEEVVEKAKKVLAEVSEERYYYEFLGECFSNKSGGFKKYFIGEMIELFNQKVNQFLPFFFNEKVEIKFNRDLVETIKFDGNTVTFSSFSRGQKMRAEIAIAFALFSVSRVFFANQSGLLVVDELLDNGLDRFGIKAAISVLDSFAQDSKVFVVSHNQEVKDNIDNVIEIKKDENGFSYIA